MQKSLINRYRLNKGIFILCICTANSVRLAAIEKGVDHYNIIRGTWWSMRTIRVSLYLPPEIEVSVCTIRMVQRQLSLLMT